MSSPEIAPRLSPLVELRRNGVLTSEVAKQLAETGEQVRIRGPRVAWDEVLDRYQDKGELSPADLEQIQEFTVAAQLSRRALEKRLKTDAHRTRDLEKLATLDAYLEPAAALQQAYLEAATKVSLQAVAGATFGPIGAIAAYLTWNPAPAARVETLVANMRELEQRTSPLLHQGNKMEPVHQEKLWQTKLAMLDEAAASAKAGNPVPVDVQYFEMTSSSFMGKLAEAARAGCPVRVNIDPSRPVANDTADLSVDDAPRKMRALLQLADIPGANVGISVFPVAQELGNVRELMHRKLLRVGDKVLFGGMNANEGSGENYDTGYLVQGPLAHHLSLEFESDVKRSLGADAREVYGEKMMNDFKEGVVALTPHGLATTLDALAGPSPAGTRIPAKPSYAELEALAAKLEVPLAELVDDQALRTATSRGSRKPLELTDKGTQLLARLFRRIFKTTEAEENIQRLQGSRPASAAPAGNVTAALGTTSEQREALILEAISSAEKFAYVPTFVVTKAVARSLAARRDELKAQGKDLDVRVVADSGVYQFGGTPNEEGYIALEDAGIPVRWALLTRVQADHDRKIHAKQILTDKMELVGSTNLSNKGIRDNWELSGLVYFDPASPESMAARADGVKRFQDLWENESIALDTRAAMTRIDTSGLGTEEARKRAVRACLGMITSYEGKTAKFTEQQMEASPAIHTRAKELQSQGMAYGYARLHACQEVLGKEAFFAALKSLPFRDKLEELAAPLAG